MFWTEEAKVAQALLLLNNEKIQEKIWEIVLAAEEKYAIQQEMEDSSWEEDEQTKSDEDEEPLPKRHRIH